MKPILFHIGPVPIYGYGFMMALGFLVSYYLALKKSKKYGISQEHISNIFPYLIIGGILGGRIFHVLIEEPHWYLKHPLAFFKLWDGGMVFYGGLFGAIVAAWIYAKKHNISFIKIANYLIIFVPLGQVFGRFGCTLAGCCYGKPTNVPWAITITNPQSITRPLGVPVHPTQLYHAFSNFIVFLILYHVGFKNKKGENLLLYGIFYSIGRFIVEFYRGDKERGFVFGGLLSTSQFISIIVFSISIIILIWLKYKKKKN